MLRASPAFRGSGSESISAGPFIRSSTSTGSIGGRRFALPGVASVFTIYCMTEGVALLLFVLLALATKAMLGGSNARRG